MLTFHFVVRHVGNVLISLLLITDWQLTDFLSIPCRTRTADWLVPDNRYWVIRIPEDVAGDPEQWMQTPTIVN